MKDARFPKEDRAGRIALALSNPVRLRIVVALAQRQMHVDDLAERLHQTRGNTSAQLKVLYDVGLLERRRVGRLVYYRLAGAHVEQLVTQLLEVAWGSATGSQAIEALEPERARQLLTRVRQGSLVLLDVRSEDDFRAAHLPGARSLPFATLQSKKARELGLEPVLPVALYCRGRCCDDANAAANLLRQQGFEVENLYTSVVELAYQGIVLQESEHSPLSPG